PEASYGPIPPCRIADTRLGGGAIQPASPRALYVRGTSGFVAQGGASGGCGVPLGATAVSASVTTTQATGPGYLTAYPNGSAAPLANFTTYYAHQNLTVNPTFALAA